MIGALALLAAYALDRGFGEPPNALHPVAWLGRLIARGRDWALLAARRHGQLARGIALALAVPACAALAVLLALRAAAGHPLLLLLVTALLLKPLFAVRALREAAFAVRDALDAGQLEQARDRLRSLCSRPAQELQTPELIAATIESVAENASDSVVAPVLFFTLLGLPGAAFYRACNTLDAMIGYHGRFEWVGKASARLDDALNLVPARLTAALLLLVAPFAGGDARRGFAVWRRDARETESPNAGHPMATMAGLLGVRLEKPGHYALGDATRPLASADITLAWRLVAAASFCFVLSAAALLAALEATGG